MKRMQHENPDLDTPMGDLMCLLLTLITLAVAMREAAASAPLKPASDNAKQVSAEAAKVDAEVAQLSAAAQANERVSQALQPKPVKLPGSSEIRALLAPQTRVEVLVVVIDASHDMGATRPQSTETYWQYALDRIDETLQGCLRLTSVMIVPVRGSNVVGAGPIVLKGAEENGAPGRGRIDFATIRAARTSLEQIHPEGDPPVLEAIQLRVGELMQEHRLADADKAVAMLLVLRDGHAQLGWPKQWPNSTPVHAILLGNCPQEESMLPQALRAARQSRGSISNVD